jgi:endonuclease G
MNINFEAILQVQAEIGAAAKRRYDSRSGARNSKLQEIQTRGIIEAAGATHAARRMAHATVAEGRSMEAMIGRDDTDHVNFLLRGWQATKSVCRLRFGPRPIGTGFLIAPGVLMTNNHVISDVDIARGMLAEFDYELDEGDVPFPTRVFNLDPDRLFITNPLSKLDFTIVAVGERNAAGDSLSDQGWLPLDERTDKILEGEPIVIIQHPMGRQKRICLFDSQLVDRPDPFIHYTTDTEAGSSGSPSFNRSWQVVGLHHASVPTDAKSKGGPVVLNEGIRISRIIAALRTNADLTTSVADGADRVLALLADPRVLGKGRPTAPLATPARTPTPTPALEATGTIVRTRPASHYQGRSGYDPNFLDTAGNNLLLRVPLPEISQSLRGDILLLNGSSTDFELRYEHYSVVMSVSRKLAFFSAANLDGVSAEAIGRKDRDPDAAGLAPESAADDWFFDPRIPNEAQIGPDIYDRTKFDFGHITRRLDPVWGNPRIKRVANDDTFHMTNCAPQHQDLNRKTWEHLEEAVYKAATKTIKRRMIVISGPILDPRDPVLLEVQCPTAFFKIVAWAENGKLASMGFMQWQTTLVEEIRRELEAIKELEKAQEWRVSVREIARLTGLDLEPLVAADDLSAKGGKPIKLTESLVDGLFPA